MRLSMLTLAFPLLAANYTQEVATFRADREKSLISENGWTTVVGLTWLKEGDNRVDFDSIADVGTFTLKAGHVQFHPAAGVKLPAQELKEDVNPLTLGTLKFFLIRRGDKFGIRVKDSEAKARKEFTHLSWYPVDPAWRIVAKFTPWDKPHKLSFDTVIPGLKEDDESPRLRDVFEGWQANTGWNQRSTRRSCPSFSAIKPAVRATYAAGRFLDIGCSREFKGAGHGSSGLSTRPIIRPVLSLPTRLARCRLRRTAFLFRYCGGINV